MNILGRALRRRSQSAAFICLLTLGLAGCEVAERLPKVNLFEASTFVGGAVADEPRAAIAAHNVLAAGGSAADAAVALYFALSVTYPEAASLGGGGICLVYARGKDKDTVETLDFLPRNSSVAPAAGARPSAVPGAVRGMYALQSRYGRLPWPQLLAPAESLARFGHPASRALVRDLNLVGAPLFADPTARAVFSRRGKPVGEGETVVQLDLSTILSALRTRGAGDFYVGAVARQLVEAAARVGGTLSLQDLIDYRPHWRGTLSRPYGDHVLHAAPSAGGATAMAIWTLLETDDRYADAAPGDRAHLFAEASMRAFADRQKWLDGGDPAMLDSERLAASMASYNAERHTPVAQLADRLRPRLENPAASSFAVVDSRGMGVICLTTMNNLFGTGRIAPEMGIFLAAAPQEPDLRASSLAPVMLVNHVNQQLFFAAAATGGATAPSALAELMLGVLFEDQAGQQALARPRLHHGGIPDRVWLEPGVPPATRAALENKGHRVGQAPEIGRANVVHCSGGLESKPKTCTFDSDKRGFGMAVSGQF